ncbi:hypothetical protein [Ramlibacter algicola]|uniref:YARHG domain-containing protein n=1 Tax=Ramlibacter algicola TaxID=2795217 RepID=A0A934UR86_9BURK|nr:hypothetical protein [Ramlibacter algicola]MBK0392423.1 hypothetical protein [Ramlibacter algicola]
MKDLRAFVIGAAALAFAVGAAAQAAGQPKRPASAAASTPPLVFADENDPTLPRRGSEEDCRAWRAEYAKSQACFAPYRTATGGLKAEAFLACGPEVLDPSASAECGIRRAR